MVDPDVFHPRRSGRDALRVIARAEDLTGGDASMRCSTSSGSPQPQRARAGGYSMGMWQRLALGAALLGDPGTLGLDQPGERSRPEGVAGCAG